MYKILTKSMCCEAVLLELKNKQKSEKDFKFSDFFQLCITLYTACDQNQLPALSPILKIIGSSSSSFNNVITYFPVSGSPYKSGKLIQVKSNRLKEVDNKKVLDNRPIKVIESFNKKRISDIHECVKINGALTLIISDYAEILNFISNIHSIQEKFKYCSNFGDNRFEDIKKEKISLFIDFFDLPFVIPIYKKSKASGIGICLTLNVVNDRRDPTRTLAKTNFVVSEFPDNLHYIDGQVINKPGHISGAFINYVMETITRITNGDTKKSKVGKSEIIFPKLVAKDKVLTIKDKATANILDEIDELRLDEIDELRAEFESGDEDIPKEYGLSDFPDENEDIENEEVPPKIYNPSYDSSSIFHAAKEFLGQKDKILGMRSNKNQNLDMCQEELPKETYTYSMSTQKLEKNVILDTLIQEKYGDFHELISTDRSGEQSSIHEPEKVQEVAPITFRSTLCNILKK